MTARDAFTFVLGAVLAGGLTAVVAQAQPIGYGGPRIQLHPIMVPYRGAAGVYYAPVTIRLVLREDGEKNVTARQRSACYSAPLIHEKFLIFLHGAGLRAGDLTGRNAEVVTGQLHEVAERAVGPGILAGVEFVEVSSPPLSPISRTLSTQCR